MQINNSLKNKQSGNALIYVLIAIALFAALGFTLARQNQNSNTNEIDAAKADLYALEIITYATQAKSVIDQMSFTGSEIDDLIFTLPSEASFNNAPLIHKVFHPQGGGLTPDNIPAKAINEINHVEVAGWYLSKFNNVEWTDSASTDVILTAYQIAKPVCEAINEKITGLKTIPALTNDMSNHLIDTATNNDLDIATCAACEGYMSLCVSNPTVTAFSFYTVVADR